MTNIKELQNVPDLSFSNDDIETLLNALISTYESAYKEITGETKILYPGDKIRIILYTIGLVLIQSGIIRDLSAKSNFLKYAKGAALDNIGATRHSITRNPAKKAKVPIKFTLAEPLNFDIQIAINKRVTAGDSVFFATTEICIIESGLSEKIFELECTQAGEIGNNYPVGSINTLVDPIPYVQSVENTAISQGGAETESDDNYTLSIWEAPEGYSVTGPEEAYIFRTKRFSQLIDDVMAYSPEESLKLVYCYQNNSQNVDETPVIDIENQTLTAPNLKSYEFSRKDGILNLEFDKPVTKINISYPLGGVVEVVPLLSGANIPDEAFLKELENYLTERKYRPLTDKVRTKAPTHKEYSVNFNYWIDADDKDYSTEIQNAVIEAVNDYISWQGSKLSRDINPDELIIRVKQAGAKRLEIISPEFIPVKNAELAKCTEMKINYKGLEE